MCIPAAEKPRQQKGQYEKHLLQLGKYKTLLGIDRRKHSLDLAESKHTAVE